MKVMKNVPYPFTDWQILQSQILGVLEHKERKVENGSQPIKFCLCQMSPRTDMDVSKDKR